MSQTKHANSLTDFSARTWTDGEDATASLFQGEFDSMQTAINDLNNAVQDLASSQSGTSAPSTNVAGQQFWDTSTERLGIEVDGSGTLNQIPRVPAVNITAVSRLGNAAGTLIVYSVPADTLKADGKIIRFTCWGNKTLSNADTGIEIRWGTTVLETFNCATTAGSWKIVVLVIRTGSSTQDIHISCMAVLENGTNNDGNASSATFMEEFETATETDTAAIQFDLRNDGSGNVNDEVFQEGLIVEVLN